MIEKLKQIRFKLLSGLGLLAAVTGYTGLYAFNRTIPTWLIVIDVIYASVVLVI